MARQLLDAVAVTACVIFVKLTRRAIRAKVRLYYVIALAAGNGLAAGNCREWLDAHDPWPLYPPEDRP